MDDKIITKADRQNILNQNAKVIWFTGFSGSGKTTLSNALERDLYSRGFKTFVLDGDILRTGLCKDLGFSEEDRRENIRRAGEVAKLIMHSGVIVLAAFITPFEKDRDMLRELIGNENFILVHVDCPIEVCEQRDVKGLYKKAREGKVEKFTGISSPFETPETIDLVLKTAELEKDELKKMLLDYILPVIIRP